MPDETPPYVPEVPPPAPPNPRTNTVSIAYAIFEGGGAKGITHVGALAAMARERISLAGVAGASAGAIIAALAAIGYSSDELYRRGVAPGSASTDILTRNKLDPVKLLGGSWATFTFVRQWTLKLTWVAVIVALALAVTAALFGARLLWLSPLALAPMLPIVIGLWPVFARRGLFSSTDLANTMNDLLRARLKIHYAANRKAWPVDLELIRFRHLDPVEVPQCLPLKLVVSDVSAQRLIMFDRQATPDAVVADVVAASAAIPFFFQPPQIRGTAMDGDAVYADGGLVSNLPAWVFSSERRLLERDSGGSIPTLAFTLVDQATPIPDDVAERRAWRLRPRPGALQRFFEYLGNVVRTGIFGSQSIVQELIAGLVVIDLHSPLGTLAFDCSRAEADAAYDVGLREAGRVLATRRLTQATEARLLAALRDRFETMLPSTYNRTTPGFRTRASIVDRLADGSFRVTAAANFASGDADDRLQIDPRGRGAPRAWAERAPTLLQLTGLSNADLVLTKYERALLPHDIQSVISIPVFAIPVSATTGARPEPERIVCFDSSADLAAVFNDPHFLDMLQGECVVMAPSEIADVVEELVNV